MICDQSLNLSMYVSGRFNPPNSDCHWQVPDDMVYCRNWCGSEGRCRYAI